MLGTKKYLLNNRGIYSLFSAFILIIVLITAVLLIIYLGLSSEIEARITSEQTSVLQQSNNVRNQIVSCWKEFSYDELSSRNVDSANLDIINKCVPNLASGYEIKSFGFFGCREDNWEFGNNANCNKRTSYLTNIIGSQGQKCLGQLLICFGD